MNDTKSDTELIQHLDFEHAPICEVIFGGQSCSHTASFIGRCRYCSVSYFFCWACRVRIGVVFAAPGGAECRTCVRVSTSLDEAYEFIPIGGAK